MKSVRFYLVLAGILPLGILASVNLMGALTGERAPAAPLDVADETKAEPMSLEERTKLAQQSVKDMDAAKPIVEKLDTFDLFGVKLLEDPPVAPKTSRFGPPAESWSTLKKSQNLAVDVGRTFQKQGTKGDRLVALKDVLDLPLIKTLPGAKGILDYVESAKKLEEDAGDTKEKVTAARLAYDSDDFAKCLDLIAEIRSRKPDEALTQEIDVLEGHANFWKHWKKNLPGPSESPSAKLRKLRLLLVDGAPAATDAKEREFVEQQKTRMVELESEEAIDKLFASPPDDIGKLIDRSEQLVEDNPKLGETLNRKFRDLLSSKFAEKSATGLAAGIQEVKLKDGTYLRGVFKLAGGQGGAQAAYKYWKSLADFNTKPGEYVTKYENVDFEGRPGASQDVLLAKAYNEKLRDLRKNLDVESKWEEFSKSCETYQQQMNDYLGAFPSAKALSFQDEEKFARDVHKSWSRIKSYISE